MPIGSTAAPLGLGKSMTIWESLEALHVWPEEARRMVDAQAPPPSALKRVRS